MLGYRHAFHAGNHADVLKHTVLCGCLAYMVQKDKPLLYADTHAGAGAYRLSEGYAAQNREWEAGLERLKAYSRGESPPPLIARYLETVDQYRKVHPGEYPGSPALAAEALRPSDTLILWELHPADHAELSSRFRVDRRVRVRKEDGCTALKSVLPPPSRRGLVFLDPSYEVGSDYDSTLTALEDALRRFATGTFVLWHPLLDRPESRGFPDRVQGLSDRPGLYLDMRIRGLAPGGRGLAGSGMVVLNPPWPLEAALREALPCLCKALGQDGSAGWGLRSFP